MKSVYKLLRNGIFPVDKPKDIYSAQVLENIKSILREQLSAESGSWIQNLRVGHGGTLDFSATGVLVIATGFGCKKLSSFLKGDKSYTTIGKLGEETTTFNDRGKVVATKSFDHITRSSIDKILGSRFTGEIWQTPPRYSALKQNGKRCSDLAIEGKDFEMKPRKVFCQSVVCTDFQPPFFKLELSCGGGFYVRSLVHDLGKDLGTYAHVTDLRRTSQGPFTLEDCLSEEDWTAENILESIQNNLGIRDRKFAEQW